MEIVKRAIRLMHGLKGNKKSGWRYCLQYLEYCNEK